MDVSFVPELICPLLWIGHLYCFTKSLFVLDLKRQMSQVKHLVDGLAKLLLIKKRLAVSYTTLCMLNENHSVFSRNGFLGFRLIHRQIDYNVLLV